MVVGDGRKADRGKPRSEKGSGMQIVKVGRLIGPAAQGWDCTERNAIANTTNRHFRDSIRRTV